MLWIIVSTILRCLAIFFLIRKGTTHIGQRTRAVKTMSTTDITLTDTASRLVRCTTLCELFNNRLVAANFTIIREVGRLFLFLTYSVGCRSPPSRFGPQAKPNLEVNDYGR